MSVKTEIPGVNNAVQKLEELADRMRTDDFGFRNNDVDNIDKVIDALHELETERKKMHEELEKETINSSILRHRLKLLPGQIRDEIMEAVMSARLSNANVLLELQEKLKGMNANITALDKQARELEQENAVLHPERELLKQQHEEIISQLNQRMAEKACMQIALNETRDKVRQANQDIVDLEDGILQLKEDLIQERTEARQEKKRLKKAVTDTTQKTKVQKEQNVSKKIELDVAQEHLMDSEGKLDTVRKSIRCYETSRAKLEGEERALAAQLSKQLKMNDQMRIRGAEIMNNRIQEERNFKDRQQELLDTIQQFQDDILSESARSKDLEQKKVELLLDLREKEEVMAEDAERVAELDALLQAAKEALNNKAEEVGAMQTENIEMSEQIESLAESHKAVLAQLNKQIEEYRDQLSKERKERMEVQAFKENVSKNLDDLKTENQFFMTEMTNVVQDGKRKHQDLSNEGMQLQKTLKADEEEISSLEAELDDVQRKYQSMFEEYQKRANMMEEEMDEMRNLLAEKRAILRQLKQKMLDTKRAAESMSDTSCSGSSSFMAFSGNVPEELSIGIDELDTFMNLTPQEILELTEWLAQGWDPHAALRKVSLTEKQKTEVLSLEEAQEEKKRRLEEETPKFHDLEAYFAQRTEEYDRMKKEIVAMKNRKQSLEEEIRRTKKEKETLKQPQEQMRKDLKFKRQQLMEQMQTQGKSTQDMEQDILKAGCKLRTIVEENHKFDESCQKLEDQLADLRKQMAENERIKAGLHAELTKQKQELMKKWEADSMMQDFFASRDEATAEAFGRLLSRTEKRENKIDMITERLKEELYILGGFLDNISTRRPQESKEQEGSMSPGKAVEAVAEANQGSDGSLKSLDTAATRTITAVASSRSPHSARQPPTVRSALSSRHGTARSQLSTNSNILTPRSVLKSPKPPSNKSNCAKNTSFADSTK